MRHIVPGLLLSLLIAGSATLQSQVQAQSAVSSGVVNLKIAQPSPRAIPHAENLSTRLRPTDKIWILNQANTKAQIPALDLDTLSVLIREHLVASVTNWPRIPATAGGPAEQDIETLAFMVMMQATQNNEDDLKSQIASLQAINQQKSVERRLLEDLNSELAQASRRDLSCTSPVFRSLSGRVESINDGNSSLGRPSRFEVSPNMSYQQVANLQLQLSQNLESMNEVSDMTSMRLQMTMNRRSKFIQALSTIEKKITDTSSAIVQNLK